MLNINTSKEGNGQKKKIRTKLVLGLGCKVASTQACILDSDPQHLHRRPGAVEGVYNLNTREEETGKVPGANWPKILAGLVSSKFSEKISKK